MRSTILFVLSLQSCAVTPTYVYDLMDADSDAEVTSAVRESVQLLGRRRTRHAVRMAAAKTLGRLRSPDAVDALSAVLLDTSEPAELRSYVAWSLGEMRHERSLPALIQVLKTDLNPRTGTYVLEALAKHFAVVTKAQDRLLTLAEAMVFYAGNQKKELPAIYDLVRDRTRTLPVNIRVLERSIDGAATNDPKALAAMYTATFELFASMERAQSEIVASGQSISTQVAEAVHQSQRTFATGHLRTMMLVLWYLGTLSELKEIGTPASSAFSGRVRDTVFGVENTARSEAMQLVATWALARMLLFAPGPRQTLLNFVPRTTSPSLLRLLEDASAKAEEYDQLQKIVGALGETQ